MTFYIYVFGAVVDPLVPEITGDKIAYLGTAVIKIQQAIVKGGKALSPGQAYVLEGFL